MMISNSAVHSDPTCSSRQNGARCSAEVISHMGSHMAQPSSSLTVTTQLLVDEETSDDADSPRSTGFPRHPFSGFLYSMEDFEVLEMLGEGFFSKVLKVRNKNSNEEMVLKVSKLSAVSSRRVAHADAAREAGMLGRLQHTNILALKGLCIERCNAEWDLHLLVDYCAGGSLNRYILDRSLQFPWYKRVKIALDIATAMEFIHSQGIIHRDLTSMNVLLRTDADGNKQAVVADFGLSCPFPRQGEKLPQVGTTYYMSPECLKEEFYDEKADVFSFGVILCQLIARIDADPDSGLHRTSNFGLDYILFTPCCPLDTPLDLLKLAFNTCLLDPTWRPSFESISASLRKMTDTMPRSPSSERLTPGKESRLGRSRSDAALRKPKGVSLAATRKLSNTLATSHCRPVPEGVEDDSLTAMKALARDKAKVEPSHKHTNPFRIHERFRTQRKIFPLFSGRRRRSETKTEPVAEERVVKRWYRRRCTSLPAEIDSDSLTVAGGGEEETDGSPGGIPMAFRDYDLKFLKSMKRFPSRRHTMIPDCSGIKSTLDLQSMKAFEASSARMEPQNHFSTVTSATLSPVTEAPSDDTPDSPVVLPSVSAESLSSSSSSFHSLNLTPSVLGDRLNNNNKVVMVDSVVRSSHSTSSRMCSFGRSGRRKNGCVIL